MKKSFAKSLFSGHVDTVAISKYPRFNTPQEDDFQLMSTSLKGWIESNVNSLVLDEEKKLSQEILQGLRELGMFGLIIPEEHGGSQFTQTLYTRTLELLNYYDTSVTLTVGAHSSIGLKGLYLFGNPEQKAKYMPKLASGEMIAAFALTEPTAGSDAAAIKSRVEVKDGKITLNGSKLWITNGGIADFFTVFAQENIQGKDQISAFIVTRDLGGVSHGPEEQKLGIKASSTVEVYFKDVIIPPENRLGSPGEGFKIAMAILNQGRLGLAGGAIGGMKSVLNQCLGYIKTRKTFGLSIDNYEMIQNLIVDMVSKTYASEAMTYFTTYLCDTKEWDYSIEAAMCKVYSTEAAWKCTDIAMQIHGGNGYMKDYHIERKLRDSRIAPIFEGTNEILKIFVSLSGIKEIGQEYKKANENAKNLISIEDISNLIHKLGFITEFALKEIKHYVSPEKVDIFDETFIREQERLNDAVSLLSIETSRLIRTYGSKLIDKQMQLARIADIATNTYMMACVLARAQAKKNDPLEVNIVKLVIRNAKVHINQMKADIRSNTDPLVKKIFQSIKEMEKYPFNLS